MGLRRKISKFLVVSRYLASVFFLALLVLSLFYLPYYAGRRIAWTFVWNIQQEIAPLVALFQVFTIIILVGFYIYLHRQKRILSKEKEELASAIANLEVGFFREKPDGFVELLEVNDGLVRVLGYSEAEVFEVGAKKLYANPEDHSEIISQLQARGCLIKEVVLCTKSGQKTWAILSGKAIKSERGELRCFEFLIMDISERKWMEQEVSSAYLRFESVIQNTPNIAIQGYSLDGKILEWNYASEILYGYSKKEVVSRRGRDLFLIPEQSEEFEKIFDDVVKFGRPAVTREWQAKTKLNKSLTVYSSIFPVLQNDKVIEIFCMDVDITGRVDTEKRLKEIRDKLEGLALKDSLTELYNFRYFRERLVSEFERAKRSLSSLSVAMMDIDYFKSINDGYGHQFGDKVLKQVARFLKSELRANDVVARWGGEEFAIILPETNREDALAVANKLLELFRTRTFGDGPRVIKIKSSIGIVSFPEDPVFSSDEMVDAVEETIYRVKERGGDGVALFQHEIGDTYTDKFSEDDRKRYIESVKQKLAFYARRSERSILEAIYSLAKSIELKDRRTREHCDRMVDYAEKMARKINLSEQQVTSVRRAAMLHDIGKLGIADAILLKPGKLTPQEYEVVKNHPMIGAEIVSTAGFLKDIVPLILGHHERYDGAGYPRGLKGEEIPLGARILAVVDVFEALTSDRPYHKAISKEEAIKILKEGAGTQFDAHIVKVFLGVVE